MPETGTSPEMEALRARIAAAQLAPEVADFWRRAHVKLKPDASRTVLKPFELSYPDPYSHHEGDRVQAIIARVIALDENGVTQALAYMKELLDDRHRNLRRILERRADEIAEIAPDAKGLGEDRRLLIGGLFSEEYAFEAAALFNPSIVRAPDQAGIPAGSQRFICSLRGIGEGHVSSVTFRTGTWNGRARIAIDRPSPYSEPPRIETLSDDGNDLQLRFDDIQDISEAVLFPMTPSPSRGLEDLRMVEFHEDDGSTRYLGTFTAFDGITGRAEMLSTTDFRSFHMCPLTGRVAQNKGMALFPRKIDGRYAMIGRQDNENIWLMRSDDLYHWDEAEKIVSPQYFWEFVQMGNCGSPIEIDEGWLLMTHGVGPVRNYTVGAVLLDRDDPSKVLARANIPLLRPGPEQRDGYVPNVVYSCGSLIAGRRLLVPYGIADNFASFVTCDIAPLLAQMS